VEKRIVVELGSWDLEVGLFGYLAVYVEIKALAGYLRISSSIF